jgi:hypothetical protein
MTAINKELESKAQKLLVGAKITEVRYFTDEEMEESGWSTRPLVIALSNKTVLYAACDEEGNDGGCLFTNRPTCAVL